MSEEPRELAAEAVGAALGTVRGWAMGGPAGAVAGAAATPYAVEVARRAFGEAIALRYQTMASFLAQTADRLEIPTGDVVSVAATSVERRALLADGLEASARTVSERKVAALAKAVANGLGSDRAHVDAEAMIVRALADLEEPHIKVLLRLPDHTHDTDGTHHRLRGSWNPQNSEQWF
jgi:hypothetical protein